MTPGAQIATVLWSVWLMARAPGGSAEAPVALEWEAPETCPKELFVERLSSYLEGGEITEARVVRARARVEQGTQLWHLDLEIEQHASTSRREFSAPTCETVADAGAFVLAVAIEPGVRDRHPEPLEAKVPGATGLIPEPSEEAEAAAAAAEEPTPEELPEEEPEEATEEEPEGEPPADEPTVELKETALPAEPTKKRKWKLPRLGFSFAVLGGVDTFALPGVGAQIRSFAGVIGRRWRADLWGDYRFATEQKSSLDIDVGGRFSRWAVGVRGCWLALDRPRVQFPLCGGIEAGQVIGSGIGSDLDRPRTSSLAWVAPAAAVALWWYPIYSLGLGVEVGVASPLLRHEFGVGGVEEPVHTLGPVVLSSLAGLQARLW